MIENFKKEWAEASFKTKAQCYSLALLFTGFLIAAGAFVVSAFTYSLVMGLLVLGAVLIFLGFTLAALLAD